MGNHLKKCFSSSEVVEIFERYLSREIGLPEAMGLLKIKRRQFFNLLKSYREKGKSFQLADTHNYARHKISSEIEEKILTELAAEKALIKDPHNPIRFYNYSYVQNRLNEKHELKVSLPTIITRAKKTVITRNVRPNLLICERSSPIM